MFLLSKLLPLFILPLTFSLLCLLWGASRRRPRAVWIGLCFLLVSSNPVVGRFVIRAAEGWVERPAISTLPTADAIVVLSAGRVLAPGSDQISEWNEANRFFGGFELFKAQKAPRLVFTGAGLGLGGRNEGDVLASTAMRLGIPAAAIMVTDHVLNTADEALATAAVLRAAGLTSPRILLVTSAFHMPRAREIFTRQGFDVVPYPVDFAFSANRRLSPLDVFPSVAALEQTHTALRELYGRGYYWLRALR